SGSSVAALGCKARCHGGLPGGHREQHRRPRAVPRPGFLRTPPAPQPAAGLKTGRAGRTPAAERRDSPAVQGVSAGFSRLSSMRSATWNINSVRTREDRVRAFLERSDVDVLCLQETKCTDKQFPDFSDTGYEQAHHGLHSFNGVAILSRVGLEDVQTE